MQVPERVPKPPPWASQLLSVGVTGTNGKTTTTRWVAAALGAVATPVVRGTTVGFFLDETRLDVSKDFAGFMEAMHACASKGGRYAALELTSEALARGFARAWPCKVGVFTNLTHDHLDAHGSPEHYLASKAQLFIGLAEGGTAVLNAADASSSLLRDVVPQGVSVRTYAVPSRGAIEGARPSRKAAASEVAKALRFISTSFFVGISRCGLMIGPGAGKHARHGIQGRRAVCAFRRLVRTPRGATAWGES